MRILIVHYPPGMLYSTSLSILNFLSPGALKLQKEREKAKSERKKDKKDRKKEKKEKKRDKTEKKESSNLGFDKAAQESKGRYLFKCLEDEAEQLERSNLTEEHGNAVCSQNSSCSSDSTQNSNKRKRPDSPSHSGIHAHGSIIRIRLSKKGRQDEMPTSEAKCFVVPAQQDAKVSVSTSAERVNYLSTTTTNNQRPPLAILEPSPSTSGRMDHVAIDKTATASCSKVHENSIEFQYKNLIEYWLPPSIQSEQHDFDDQDWLFQRKPKQKHVEERNAVGNDTSCGSSSLWPRAQYIHDAELYALPFTVPF